MTVATIGLLFVANQSNAQSPTFNRYNFPEGTEFNRVENTVYFTVPEGYTVIGVTESEAFVNGGRDGSVRCRCESGGGGCNPGHFKGHYGCVMTGCENCTKLPSVKISDNYVGVQDMIVFKTDHFDLVSNFSDLEGKVLLPAVFHKHPIVLDFFNELQEGFSKIEEGRSKIVFGNFGNYIFTAELSVEDDTESIYMNNSGETGSFKCHCNVEGKKCPKSGRFGATFCDATKCSDCSLSGIIINPRNGNTKSLTIEDDVIVLH